MRRLILFLAIILLISSACTKSKQDSMPDVGVPSDDLNTTIQLEAPVGLNTFKIGGWVDIVIRIVDNNKVWFPKDNGVRIFAFKNDQWIEINNLADYSRIGDYVAVPYDNNPFNLTTASVVPEVTDKDKSITIRIFVIGNLIEDGVTSEKKIGGYIDVRLSP